MEAQVFDERVLMVGAAALVTSLSIPAEWVNVLMGAVVTGLVSYIATMVSQGQKTREDTALSIKALQTQTENIEDRFDRLEDHINAMWVARNRPEA